MVTTSDSTAAGSAAAPKIAHAPAKASSGSRAILATAQQAVLQRHPDGLPQADQHVVLQDEEHPERRTDDEGEHGQRAVAQERQLVGPERLAEQEDGGRRHRGGRAQRVAGDDQPAAGRSRRRQEADQAVAQPEGGQVGQQGHHRDQGRADADRRGRQPAGGEGPEDQTETDVRPVARISAYALRRIGSLRWVATRGAHPGVPGYGGSSIDSGPRAHPDVVDLEGRREGCAESGGPG